MYEGTQDLDSRNPSRFGCFGELKALQEGVRVTPSSAQTSHTAGGDKNGTGPSSTCIAEASTFQSFPNAETSAKQWRSRAGGLCVGGKKETHNDSVSRTGGCIEKKIGPRKGSKRRETIAERRVRVSEDKQRERIAMEDRSCPC